MLPKSLTYLTLIIFIMISACKKSSLPPSLTSITQEGKNTFGCLIDGKVFTPKKRFNSYNNLRANYSTIDRGTFNIITKLTSKIISGTFSFDAISSGGEKVEIREGRFDLNIY